MASYLESSSFKRDVLLFAWCIALSGMLGSLYFSEIMDLPPCVLCWYQRIALYPLVILIPLGIWKKIQGLHYLFLGLTIPGLLVSIYHNLLYWKILPESAAPCVQGVSCTTRFIEIFGFITIPFMALMALLVLNGCMISLIYLDKKYRNA